MSPRRSTGLGRLHASPDYFRKKWPMRYTTVMPTKCINHHPGRKKFIAFQRLLFSISMPQILLPALKDLSSLPLTSLFHRMVYAARGIIAFTGCYREGLL
jgi:hypothetical protein